MKRAGPSTRASTSRQEKKIRSETDNDRFSEDTNIESSECEDEEMSEDEGDEMSEDEDDDATVRTAFKIGNWQYPERGVKRLLPALRILWAEENPQDAASPKLLAAIRDWALNTVKFKSTREKIAQVLVGEVHESIRNAISASYCDAAILNLMKGVNEKLRSGTPAQQKIKSWTYQKFMSLYYQLDEAKIDGIITLDAASEICAPCDRQVTAASRVHTVILLCPEVDGEMLWEKCSAKDNARTHLRQLSAANPSAFKHVRFSRYWNAARYLGVTDLRNLLEFDSQKLQAAIKHATAMDAQQRGARDVFTIFEAVLLGEGRKDTIDAMVADLPITTHGKTCLDRLNPWSFAIADMCYKAESLAGESRRSYKAEKEKYHRQECSTIIFWMDAYAEKTFREFMEDDDTRCALQFMFETAKREDYEQMVVCYANSRKIGERRTSNNVHTGMRPLVRIVGVLKNGVRAAIKCTDIELMVIKILRKRVINRDKPADESVRVTLNNEEFDRMYKCCKSTRDRLLLTVFRETGLRSFATRNIKMKNVLDEHRAVPRVISVMEKGKKIRRFMPETTLKTHIIQHCDRFILHHNYDPEHYIMNTLHPSKPLSYGGLTDILARLARDANVEVHLHPHVFRYTIVGQLLEAGNPMSKVSRFMGHSGVAVTAGYFRERIEDLNINNPFSSSYQEKEEKKQEHKEEHHALKKKLGTMVRMVKFLIGKAEASEQRGSSIAEYLHGVRDAIPNLDSLLDMALPDEDSDADVDSTVSGGRSEHWDKDASGTPSPPVAEARTEASSVISVGDEEDWD